MKRRFYPSLDSLEDRTVPAGNVTVSFNDGILRVLGDAEDNQISIIGDGRGNVTITGHEDTTINGRESIRVSGVKKGLEVWMRGGDDTVTISNLQLKRNAFIHMGDGDDVLNLSNLKTKRSMEVWAGEGNDQINIVGSKFRQGFVSGGDGEDIVNLIDNYFGRKSIIGGGADFDTLGGLNNTLKKKTQVVGFEEKVNGVIPTGQPDQATVNEGGSVVINVAANDSTFRGTLDLSSIVIVQNPLHGTVQVNGDGTVTYTHNGSETTSDNFQYVISNSFGNSSLPIDVFLTINPVNDAPIANNDVATVSEGGTIDINVALNDVDPEGALDLTSITIVTQPVHGTVVVNNNGTVTYTHNGSQTTSDSFTYTIRDTSGLVSNIATVSITILAVNNPPVANDDEATVDEGASVQIDVAANDTDVDGTLDLTSIIIIDQPAHGTVTVNLDGSVTYTHDGSETTSDSFTYTIRDNQGAVSNVATVNIIINPVNDAPVAVDDEVTIETGTTTIIDVAANDIDPEGLLELSSIVIVDQPQHGSLIVNNDGTVTYIHDGSDSTEDSFTYTIKDVEGLESNVATVSITIMPFNQPPVALDDEATLDEGDSIIIDLAANDSDADGTLDLTSIEIITQPLHGQVTINNDGTVTYTHDGSETTSDSFTYTIRDNGDKVSNIATVTLTINPVDDAPVAVDDEAEVDQGQSIVINVAANDSDEEGPLDLTSIEIVDQPSHGALQVNDDGTVTYTHDGSNTTSDTFTYTIRDANGNISNQATVTIVIILANQAPVAVDDLGSVANGESVVINVAENDTDADGTIDLTSIEIVDQPSHGTVQINDDGTVTYTHDGSTSDTDSFTYTIRDNLGLISNVATVNITIS